MDVQLRKTVLVGGILLIAILLLWAIGGLPHPIVVHSFAA
jgi:hypothetical protein